MELIMSTKFRGINAIAVVMLLTFAAPGLCQPLTTAGDSAAVRGLPRIIHYTKNEFNGDSQFWAMAQDAEGVLCFGNNDGALIFNG
ncbi:MAG TPA: hypothetical protein VD816_17940, partial [Ohtaekwangia sp.]|nr:hypothetical protein [Ohtaekwangia sp.]